MSGTTKPLFLLATIMLSGCAGTTQLEPRPDYLHSSVQALQTAKVVKQFQTDCSDLDLASANQAQTAFNAWAERNQEYISAAHGYIQYMTTQTTNPDLLQRLEAELETGADKQYEAAIASVDPDQPRCTTLLTQMNDEQYDINGHDQRHLLDEISRALAHKN